ncbi:hypothetical protein RB195_003441 [Necator americanus]|uniref:Uncharacterized protein n=1 Tax=Necator americanus TaxID=51031 RepID=A0ABR1DRC5_NECAM
MGFWRRHGSTPQDLLLLIETVLCDTAYLGAKRLEFGGGEKKDFHGHHVVIVGIDANAKMGLEQESDVLGK